MYKTPRLPDWFEGIYLSESTNGYEYDEFSSQYKDDGFDNYKTREELIGLMTNALLDYNVKISKKFERYTLEFLDNTPLIIDRDLFELCVNGIFALEQTYGL